MPALQQLTGDPMTQPRRLRLAYLTVSTVLVVLDQVVKYAVDRAMVLHESIPLIPGLLQLTYVRNRGGAFGLLSGGDLPLRAVLFPLINVVVFAVMLVVALRMPAHRRWVQTALSLVLGGALGNLIDRLAHGYVIDFVDVYWRSYHWPMFNVADSAISVGVCMLVLDMLREPRSPEKQPQAEIADADSERRS
jgi:signal peptidase II